MACRVREVGARHVLLVAGGAAVAAVAAGMLGAAVARNLAAVHAQLLQALLQLLVGHAVLRDACADALPCHARTGSERGICLCPLEAGVLPLKLQLQLKDDASITFILASTAADEECIHDAAARALFWRRCWVYGVGCRATALMAAYLC